MIPGDRLPALGHEQAPYAWGGPVLSADFKSQPDHFVVTEQLGFEPSGAGEHLFVLAASESHNTRHLAKSLARQLQLHPRKISYSGLKDRHGLTQQWFSAHVIRPDVWLDEALLSQEGIQIRVQRRHHKKLRIGTHKANRFTIRLVQVEGDPQLAEARLSQLQSQGVPNYFGPQRFGIDAGNLQLLQDWGERQELPCDRQLRSILLSTLRAWVFNGRLGARVGVGTWPHWQSGDAMMLAGSQSFFTPDELDQSLVQRLQDDDIRVADWLPGADDSELDESLIKMLQLAAMKPEPRALIVKPTAMSYRWEQQALVVEFELPKGCYATSVLRELAALREFRQ